LEDFSLFHVNGNMSAAQRERVLRNFRYSDRGLISNARCLTEGVDVPAVDMVAFLSPRRSLVDIVQAIGRAMRTSPATGKEFGYVLVPLFIDIAQGESIEEAVARAQFDEVWDIIQTLQEQDEALAEQIRQLAEYKGRTGKYDASVLEMIEFCGEDVAIETLTSSISIRIFDEFFTNWDIRYGELIHFKTTYGHCNVPRGYSQNNALSVWVAWQRLQHTKGNISNKRIARLDELGFEWDPQNANWNRFFDNLVAYKKLHGDCNVPRGWESNNDLSVWVMSQRQRYSKGKISDDRILKLEALGFEWDPTSAQWHRMFDELVAYKKINGDCNVPRGYSMNNGLSIWVMKMRTFYSKAKLSQGRIEKLNSIGFEWDPIDSNWHRMFSNLASILQTQRDYKSSEQGIDNNLRMWMNAQRVLRLKGKLPYDRLLKLNSIGFEWTPKDTSWAMMFNALVRFKTERGHCNVPRKKQNLTEEDFKNKKLAIWVMQQRIRYKKRLLEPEKVNNLNKIGFDWGFSLTDWDTRYQDLLVYKVEHGNCLVPVSSKTHKSLGGWVSKQRRAYKQGYLAQEKIAKLEEIGFEWSIL
jgi:hypothetical protein